MIIAECLQLVAFEQGEFRAADDLPDGILQLVRLVTVCHNFRLQDAQESRFAVSLVFVRPHVQNAVVCKINVCFFVIERVTICTFYTAMRGKAKVHNARFVFAYLSDSLHERFKR